MSHGTSGCTRSRVSLSTIHKHYSTNIFAMPTTRSADPWRPQGRLTPRGPDWSMLGRMERGLLVLGACRAARLLGDRLAARQY